MHQKTTGAKSVQVTTISHLTVLKYTVKALTSSPCTSAWNVLPPRNSHGTSLTSFRFLLKCPIKEDFAGYTISVLLFYLSYSSYPNLFLFLALSTSLGIYLCFRLIIMSSPLECKLRENRIVSVLLSALYPQHQHLLHNG